MPQTCLEIGQAVMNELGLPQVTSLAVNPNTTARQLLSLINRSGDELYQNHPWIQIQKLAVVNIGTPVTTTGDTVAGSGVITNIPDTSGITPATAFAVVGNGIIVSARVVSVDSATQVTIDEPATVDQTAVDLIFARDTYAIPEDFKWFLNRTMWDRTNRWELIGPVSPQVDEWERSGVVTTGPRRRWRQVGLPLVNWRLWPPPTASGSYPATLVFEYVSSQWAETALGVGLERMVSDTDVPRVDAQAIILGTKWRLWQAKGFANWGVMQTEYNDYVSRLAARNGGAPDLSLAKPMRQPMLLTSGQAPDGFWPGPGNE